MSSFFLFLAKIFCRREVRIMAVVYATLIVKGKKTLEDVPALLKERCGSAVTYDGAGLAEQPGLQFCTGGVSNGG